MARRARRRSQPSRSLKRSVDTRTPRKTLVVFCEGEKSEPQYLNALRKDPKVRGSSSVEIRVRTDSSGCAPKTLVDRAVAEQEKAQRNGDDIDEFWCLFDVEWPTNHPKLPQAVQKAQANEIQLGISNPCFELWLILHHENRTASLTTAEAVRKRRELDGSTGKEVDGPTYVAKREVARKHARDLDRRHERNDAKFPMDNPSSSMHCFLDSVDPSDA